MMNKDIERVVKNNRDVVDFVKKRLSEEPDIGIQALKDAIYKEFGYQRFNPKTFIVAILMTAGRREYADERETVEEDRESDSG